MEDEQELVRGFLKEFASKLAAEHDIDFILLFGSAARGEWRRGVSDVDMIIQVKRQEDKERVREDAEKLFWRLDRKYGTRFREACSTGDGSEGKVEELLKRGQRKVRLYAPFEVLGPEDVDWGRGEFKDPFFKVGLDLMAPKYLILAKMKTEGRILYGRDITREIRLRVSWFERLKALLVPHHLSFLSLMVSPFAPRMAVKMAIKAAIYSVESCLFYLRKPVGRGIHTALLELEHELGRSRYVSAEPFRRAYELKYVISDLDVGRWESMKFSTRIFYEVVKLNWWAVLSKLWQRLK